MLNALSDGSVEVFADLELQHPGLADHATAAINNPGKESWAIHDWPWRETYVSLPDEDKE